MTYMIYDRYVYLCHSIELFTLFFRTMLFLHPQQDDSQMYEILKYYIQSNSAHTLYMIVLEKEWVYLVGGGGRVESRPCQYSNKIKEMWSDCSFLIESIQ